MSFFLALISSFNPSGGPAPVAQEEKKEEKKKVEEEEEDDALGGDGEGMGLFGGGDDDY
jgi:ribosomal protein L12E/L44/L45/RPP1/RPP2